MTAQDIALFDRVADDYDRVLPFFTGFARGTVDALPLTPRQRVLDLGAGHGALTTQALYRGCRVTAVDSAPAMLERLRAEHADHEGFEGAHVMDAHRLDLPDASFEAVLSGFVLHLVDEPGRALTEIGRVLAPGGLLALTVPGAAPGEQDRPTDLLDELFEEYRAHLLPGGGMGGSLTPQDDLHGTGFSDVRARTVSVELPVPDGEALWRWTLTHGSRAFLEALPEPHREEFRARLVAGFDAAPFPLYRTAALWTCRFGR